jgi:atypical dual specificity phosphatase
MQSSDPMTSPLKSSHTHKILDYLYLGGYYSATNKLLLQKLGITVIINVTPPNEISNVFPKDFTYYNFHIEDSDGYPIGDHFDKVDAIINAYKDKTKILIHCVAGISRSSTLTIAHLMKSHKMKLLAAFNHVKAIRDCIEPNYGFKKSLIAYEYELYKNNSMKESTPWPTINRDSLFIKM